jgi:DNA uptake protein ComE-like DNA-binding protein
MRRLLSCTILAVLLAIGCTQKRAAEDQRAVDDKQAAADKDRDKAHDTGEKIGERAHEAASDIKQESKELAGEAAAAAHGIKEGWKNADKNKSGAVNVNTASSAELQKQLGLTAGEADQIILNRPYADKRDLLDRKVISPDRYNAIAIKIATK